jgi:hypothetical protein
MSNQSWGAANAAMDTAHLSGASRLPIDICMWAESISTICSYDYHRSALQLRMLARTACIEKYVEKKQINILKRSPVPSERS